MSIPPYLRREHTKLTPKALAIAGKAGSWYDIKAQADGTVAEVFIYDEIGGWGILAAEFVRDLQAIDASTVNVRISSPGGSVFEALAIYASLKNFEAKVNCIIDGLCASAATVIAMAGDEITTAPGSMWMVHDALGQVYGNAADMQQMADLLDKTSQNIADIYAARAGSTADEWRTTMQAETWYTADEAVTAGLADSLTESAKQVAAKTPVLINQTPSPAPVAFDFAELFRTAVKEAVS
jgi:ATP-dependent protease ClpP protease subunit